MRALALVLLLGGSAWADDAARERARALTAEAHQAYADGDFAAALAGYREAFRNYPSPILRYNMGLTLDQLGRSAEAVAEYEAFVADAGGAPNQQRVYAVQRIDDLAPVIARIDVSADVEGALVRVDGAERGKTPLPRALAVMPGEHTVVVERSGRRTFTTKVKVAAGASVAVEAELPVLDLDVHKVGEVDRPPPKAVWRRPWFWAAVGGAVAIASSVIVIANYDDGIPDSELGTIHLRAP